MEKIFKLKEINFHTNLKIEDLFEIAEGYIKETGENYEINRNNILYDLESHVTHEPVWYVDIIHLKTKVIWPDAYDTLAISDREKRLVYVMNDHGVVVETF